MTLTRCFRTKHNCYGMCYDAHDCLVPKWLIVITNRLINDTHVDNTNRLFVSFNYTRVLNMVFRRPQDLSGGECNKSVTWIDLVHSHRVTVKEGISKFACISRIPSPWEFWRPSQRLDDPRSSIQSARLMPRTWRGSLNSNSALAHGSGFAGKIASLRQCLQH
jgi:hypothetical protein